MNYPATNCNDSLCRPVQRSEYGRESIVLLHGSASDARMWRQSCEVLAPLYDCITPDLIGYGSSEAWPTDRTFSLDSELNAIKSLLPCCGEKMHLIGYSYGGVLALHLALSNPALIKSVTLIEPVFFAALFYSQQLHSYEKFCSVRDSFVSQLSQGNREAAMIAFTDLWMKKDAWQALSSEERVRLQDMSSKIKLDWQASFSLDPGPDNLATLASRTLLIRGDRSPAPMCELVDSLHGLMPGSSLVTVKGADHMLPFTHNHELNGIFMANLLEYAERSLK